MSKQCPYCKSYNTERSLGGTANYAVRQAGRLLVAGGTAMVVGLFNRSAGQGAGRAMLKNTENWVSGVDQFHCCNCGKDFTPRD